ncbi:MAG: nucleotidyltransferase family protein, partial [Ruminococcus sp.]|nr:nucleotidyltransferase family protein [Ruminococcus sp.]
MAVGFAKDTVMDNIHEKLLAVVRYQLFGGEKPQNNTNELLDIMKEADDQAVNVTVFPILRDSIRQSCPEKFLKCKESYFGKVLTNTHNLLEHGELHAIMTKHGIDYVAIKGAASAYYYPDPSLRVMGDVDFLVAEKNFERAKQAVLDAGFLVDHGDTEDSIHIAFKREPVSIWEMHRTVNGIPSGKPGERISADMASAIKTAELLTLDGTSCMIPNVFFHGLIMLLHMISHMTGEGIGLRHLCDWAVFAERLDSDRFVNVFEKKLKSYGIWKFAQIMTLVSERYLGIGKKSWAQDPDVGGDQLDALITDILDGGNFGKKDMNRYREIKYISNRGDRTVDDKNVVAQAFKTLNQKTCDDYGWIEKRRVFLPIGWVAEAAKYLGMLATGKRKNKGTSKMLKEAARRKSIYSK